MVPRKTIILHALILVVLSILISGASPATASPIHCLSYINNNLYCLTEHDQNVTLIGRTPLLVIHGWNPAGVSAPPEYTVWDPFINYFYASPSLSSKYKLYVFTYYSNEVSVPGLAGVLRELLDRHNTDDPSFGSIPVVFMGHSMGGLVARSFMQQKTQQAGLFAGRLGGERVLRLITLGTPHHGSPLANGPARDELITGLCNPALPFIEAVYLTPFDAVNRADLHWDNFDALIDYSNSGHPGERNLWLETVLNSSTSYDAKIAGYGGVISPPASAGGCCDDLSDTRCIYCKGACILGGELGLASDGVVPVSSSLFYSPSQQSRIMWRYFSGFDHSAIVRGNGTSLLFDTLRDDLLRVPTIRWLGPTETTMVSGETYPFSWEVLGGSSVTHTNLHWDVTDPTDPSRCNASTSPPCSTISPVSSASPGTPGPYGQSFPAPAVSTNTVYRLVAHAIVDGVTTWGPALAVTVLPAPPADNTPPPAPADMRIQPSSYSNNNLFSVTWTDPPDPSGLVRVWFKLGPPPTYPSDGIYYALPQTKPFYVAATVEGGQPIHIWLEDGAGNKSHLNRATATLWYDGTRPAVSITSPTSSGSYTTSTPQVSISGVASDNVGVSLITWSSDRGPSGSANGTVSWSIASVPLQTGSNVMTVRAQDVAGNTDTSVLTVDYVAADTTPPIAVEMLSPDPGETVSGNVTWRARAEDNSGTIQRIEFFLDGGTSAACVDNVSKPSASVFSCIWNSAATANGLHTVHILAFDPSGNAFNSLPRSFYLDNGLGPTAPTGVSAQALSWTSIQILWQDTSGETEYRLERSMTPGAGYVQVVSVGDGTTSYTDAALSVATTYYYRLRACSPSGCSGYTSDVSATAGTTPVTPQNVTAEVMSSTSVQIRWNCGPPQVCVYAVQRRTSPGGAWTIFRDVGLSQCSTLDATALPDTEYGYRVATCTTCCSTCPEAICSGFSVEVSANTSTQIPAAPSGLIASLVPPGAVALSWQDTSSNEDSMRVYRKTGPSGSYRRLTILPPDAISYRDDGPGVVPGSEYFYVVYACNIGTSAGCSASNEATVTVPSRPPVVSTQPAWVFDSNVVQAGAGRSLAGVGDVNGDGYADLLIGASNYSNGQNAEGAAFVLYGSETGFPQSPSWIYESDQVGAYLGRSVAAAGDVNGDGYSDILVAAPYWDTAMGDAGRVYLFLGSPVGLPAAAEWSITGTSVGQMLGFSIAGVGDVSGDGYDDVAVGAYGYSNNELGEGAVFLYEGGPAGLSAQETWRAEGNQAGAHFGASVASAGDVNGDGLSDVIIGAPGYSNGEIGEGRAYLYRGSLAGLGGSDNGPLWIYEENSAGAGFGAVVGSAGDVNGDGYSDILVGSPGFDGDNSDQGAASLFLGSMSGPGSQAAWRIEGGRGGVGLGLALAQAGDVDADGYEDIVLGLPEFTDTGSYRGAAFVYRGTPSGLSEVPSGMIGGVQDNEQLGTAVVTFGDFNGDGASDVLVGAPGHSDGESGEGRVSLFQGIPSSVDGDGDLYAPMQGDCDDRNNQVWATPGEVQDLALSHDRAPGTTTLTWDIPYMGGISVAFDVLRAGAPADFVGGVACIESNDSTDAAAVDLGTPPVGGVFYYLVRTENACPGSSGLGSLGSRSDGTARVGRGCP